MQDISEKTQINAAAPEEKNLRYEKLKNGKSANDIPIGYIKCALENEEFLNEMTMLYKSVWATNQIPDNWGHSGLVAIK